MPHWLCSEYPNASTLYGIFPALVLVELTVWRFHKLGRKITNRNNIDFHLTNSSTTNTPTPPSGPSTTTTTQSADHRCRRARRRRRPCRYAPV
jgi:hypothetical protein